MGLRSFRKKRRPGNRKPTDEEARRIAVAKVGPCMACLAWFEKHPHLRHLLVYGCEYNHVKSGNIRIGHGAGYAMCQWHHQGYPLKDMDSRMMARTYGPSLVDGSALFQRTYGTHAELIERQTAMNAEMEAGGVDIYSQAE